MRATTMVVILSGACAPGSAGEPPPVEAVEACAGGAVGDRCSFEGPHGPIVGICDVRQDRAGRACVPRRRPAGGRV
jgi:hypothetical protein